MPISVEEVKAVYRYILGREPESESVVLTHARSYDDVEHFRLAALRSPEFQNVTANLGLSLFPRTKWVRTDIRDGLCIWVNLSDPYVSRGCLNDDWEEPIARFLDKRISKGDCCLDIGANIGLFTILAAGQLRRLGAGHVVSFEPRSDLWAIAARSIEDNGLDSYVTLHKLALADRAGELDLAWNDDNAAASYLATGGVHEGGRHETVRVVRLDDVPMPGRIALIKSDAEGAEALVFAGAERMLSKDRPVIVSELNYERLPVVSGKTAGQFIQWMAGFGYTCHELTESGDAGEIVAATVDTTSPATNVVFLPES